MVSQIKFCHDGPSLNELPINVKLLALVGCYLPAAHTPYCPHLVTTGQPRLGSPKCPLNPSESKLDTSSFFLRHPIWFSWKIGLACDKELQRPEKTKP
jgi:hypothetical protein